MSNNSQVLLPPQVWLPICLRISTSTRGELKQQLQWDAIADFDSPQLATPRRSLFSANIFAGTGRGKTVTKSASSFMLMFADEMMTTPPLPASSPMTDMMETSPFLTNFHTLLQRQVWCSSHQLQNWTRLLALAQGPPCRPRPWKTIRLLCLKSKKHFLCRVE